MTSNEYQRAAARTICPQYAALERLSAFADCKTGLPGPSNTQLIHGLLGISAEVGELWTLVQKAVWYDTFKGDEAEFKHQVRLELGDVMWYVAEVCSAMGLSLGDVLEANIEKLRVRFPDKYTGFHAAEENRDRAAEEAITMSSEQLENMVDNIEKLSGYRIPTITPIRQAVARGWTHPANSHKVMDPDLAEAIAQEVSALVHGMPPPKYVMRGVTKLTPLWGPVPKDTDTQEGG